MSISQIIYECNFVTSLILKKHVCDKTLKMTWDFAVKYDIINLRFDSADFIYIYLINVYSILGKQFDGDIIELFLLSILVLVLVISTFSCVVLIVTELERRHHNINLEKTHDVGTLQKNAIKNLNLKELWKLPILTLS